MVGGRVADYDSGMSENGAIWLFRRLLYFTRRSTNQGIGAYLCFVAALLVALILGRWLLASYQADRSYIRGFIATELEPPTEATPGAALSLVIQAIDKVENHGRFYCRDSARGDCEIGREIWKKTEALVAAVSGSSDSSAPLEWRLSSVEREHPELASFRTLVEANAQTRTDLSLLKRLVSEQDCGDPEIRRIDGIRGAQFGFDAPLCFGSGRHSTIRIVPQQSADLGTGVDSDQRQTKRVRRAIADAELFGMAVDSSIGRLKEIASDDVGPKLVAAYFVSFDSVLEYWKRYAPIRASAFPHYKLWAGRTYVEQLLKHEGGGPRIVTRPYVDFGGNGVIYTECNAVRQRESTESLDNPSIAGAVCVDYAPREEVLSKVVRTIAESAIADACIIGFHSEAPASWSNVFPPAKGKEQAETQGEPTTSECAITRRPEVRRWLDDHVLEMSADTNERRRIVMIETGGKPMFLIPVGLVRSGVPGAIAISIEGFGTTGSRPWSMTLALIACLVAVAAWVSGGGSSKRLADREALLGRLRSLQIAVIQTDARDYITAGNDRAEEIVGRTLPNFGMKQEPVYLWELFDKDSVCVEVRGDFQFHEMEYIWSLRRRGETSTYFGRLSEAVQYRPMPTDREETSATHTCTWVKVTGGPILQTYPLANMLAKRPERRDKAMATFGVLEPADKEASRLEQMLEERRKARTNEPGSEA